MLTTMSLGALGPEKAFAVQDKMVGRQQDQQKINETIRNNDMTNARGWASNNIAQQNVNLRRMELEDKKYDRLIANETNALKLAELQDKRLQNQQAMEQAKRDKADAYNSGMDNLSRTIETATKVLNSPGFTGYFGTNLNPLSSRFIPGTEAADTETLVDTLKSQGFLSGIQQMKGMGALSNAEGQKVMDAIGSLSPNQSEKSARAAIKTIIKTTEMAQKRMQQKYGKDIQPSQQQLSDDDLINKYLGGQ
ncbi:phage DNA ejection protein [Escherichia coli]